MAQEDYVIADQTGISLLADLNNTLAAIVSNNSGATEPETMYAYQMWADTNAGILKQRNSANNAWINILTLAGIKSSDIRNTAAGGIAATTVQAALNELDTDKASKDYVDVLKINLQTAVATTSGTSIDFTGIPAGVNRLNLTLKGVSSNGTASFIVQIGDGSIKTSDYISTSVASNGVGTGVSVESTAGFVMFTNNSTRLMTSTIEIIYVGSNSWVATHKGKISTVFSISGGGDVTLAGALERLRLIPVNGTDAFDAGLASISWEF